jgi:hypothetical protein
MRNLRNWHYSWCVLSFIIFLQYNFFSYIKCKKVTTCIQLKSIICFYAYIVRRRAYVSDICNKWFSLLMIYSHWQRNENPAKKFSSNLSAKKSTLKPCNSKTGPITPDLPFFKEEIKNKLPKNWHLSLCQEWTSLITEIIKLDEWNDSNESCKLRLTLQWVHKVSFSPEQPSCLHQWWHSVAKYLSNKEM